MNKEHPLRSLILMLGVVLVLGAFGFYLFGYDLWTSLYRTIIILLSHFSHGLEEPIGEQILTIILILGSYLFLAYIIRGSAEYLFEGQFAENRRLKKMDKKIKDTKDHYIVAGYGRVGRQIAEDMKDEGVDFIVVDRNPEVVKQAESNGYLCIVGDPIKEESLKRAGIERAKCLLAALGSDTDNLFLTLTAKSLNPELFVVARASEEENVEKLEKAGADRVSLPYQIGGYHMAGIALRPSVIDFLDVITDGKHAELQVEELNIERGSNLIGAKISDYFSRQKNGVTVLAINRYDGNSVISPSGDELIHRDDQLIVMGTRSQLEKVLKEIE